MATNLMPRPQSSGDIMELPPIDMNQRNMEERFENRDFNSELYNMNARDPILVQQYDNQLKKSREFVHGQAPINQQELTNCEFC